MIPAASSRPLSILQVLEPSGGGSGRHFLDLCSGLKQRRHRVTAIYSPLRAEERFVSELTALGLEAVHAVPMTRAPGPSDLGAWRAIGRIIRESGPFDIIHGHSSKAGALTRLRLPGRHVPRVYTPHAFRTMDPGLGGAGRLIFATVETVLGRLLSDRIICVSQEEFEHARRLGIGASRLRTIINGVAPPPEGDRIGLRARLSIPDHAFVFGFIGRLSPQKAPERLVEAFARIAAGAADTHLLMIGFGELEAEVRGRIEAYGLTHRIHLTRDIPGPQAIQCFDVLVMPSRYEAMSYVALEAAAGGLPLVLTDVGGARTVLDDGRNGVLVENSDDPIHLANAMNRLQQPAAFQAFAREARLRMDSYSLATMVQKTEAVYREITAGA